jgi:hypothetical protein
MRVVSASRFSASASSLQPDSDGAMSCDDTRPRARSLVQHTQGIAYWIYGLRRTATVRPCCRYCVLSALRRFSTCLAAAPLQRILLIPF